MWACQSNWYENRIGKYHWFEAESNDKNSMFAPLCKTNVRLYWYGVRSTERTQPRHADRCKRCVAVL